MINFGDVTKENIKEHNINWPETPHHPYRILIIAGSGSRKTNSLFYLIHQQSNIDKIYLYTKHPYKAKYKFLINKRKSTDLKHFNDSETCIEYSNDMDDIYKNIEEYNSNKKRKILIAFDDTIANMLSNKKRNPVVTELLLRRRKLNIYFVFITQYYFSVPKNFRLNSTLYFITKIRQIFTFKTL